MNEAEKRRFISRLATAVGYLLLAREREQGRLDAADSRCLAWILGVDHVG